MSYGDFYFVRASWIEDNSLLLFACFSSYK